MCGASYTPASVTEKPKIHGVAEAGEAHTPIGVRCDQRRRGVGYPYTQDTYFGADILGNTGVLGFWDLIRVCFFDVHVVDMDSDTYTGTQPHKVLKRHEQRKKVKYLEAYLERRQHFTPLLFSVDGVVVEDTKADTKKLVGAFSKNWDR